MKYLANISIEDQYWLAEFPDCPGCQTFAESEQELYKNAKEALEGWLEAYLINNQVPPKPRTNAKPGLLEVNVSARLATQIKAMWLKKRAEEKQRSRDEDERALVSGEKTKEQLNAENSMFPPNMKFNVIFDITKI